VVVLEASRVGEGASGRNGGFADPSLTHGLYNGKLHFPDEVESIERCARENFAGLLDTLERHEIDACVERTGLMVVATAAYQVEDLHEYFRELQRFEEDVVWFDGDAVRQELHSPTYHAGVWRRSGANLDPARLVWGLREAAERLGVRLYEQTPVESLARSGSGIDLRCASGSVRADKVVLATNAFRSPLRRMRLGSIPIYDYALMTEPLSAKQLASLGWKHRQGVGDDGNQFHYYRLTVDNRILWGGYDAIYHFGSRVKPQYQQRPASFEGLSRRFFETFPQLEGLRFTHSWGGPIASTTRFCMDVGTAYERRLSWAAGYTGLGVVASLFGARVALDLIDRPEAAHLALGFVRKRPIPWPPEPLRCLGVTLTQRALARADRNEGRRGPWLRLLDLTGVGFDS